AVPSELQEWSRVARLPVAAAARVCRVSDRRGAAAQELERCDRRDGAAPQRLRGRVGADRRAEVPLLDPAELPAERHQLLLHAAARAECGAMVDAREERGSLQLSLLGRGAAGVFRNGGRREGAGQEVVSLYEQPFLVEVGRQRRDVEGAARAAD